MGASAKKSHPRPETSRKTLLCSSRLFGLYWLSVVALDYKLALPQECFARSYDQRGRGNTIHNTAAVLCCACTPTRVRWCFAYGPHAQKHSPPSAQKKDLSKQRQRPVLPPRPSRAKQGAPNTYSFCMTCRGKILRGCGTKPTQPGAFCRRTKLQKLVPPNISLAVHHKKHNNIKTTVVDASSMVIGYYYCAVCDTS